MLPSPLTDHLLFMRYAIEQAERAARLDEVPIGAAVVLDGAVIATAHNETRLRNDCTAHAEILALQRAGQVMQNYRLNHAHVYTTLAPCMMCAGALLEARVARIFVAAQNTGDSRDVLPWTARCCELQSKLTYGLLSEQSEALLNSFFVNKRASSIKK